MLHSIPNPNLKHILTPRTNFSFPTRSSTEELRKWGNQALPTTQKACVWAKTETAVRGEWNKHVGGEKRYLKVGHNILERHVLVPRTWAGSNLMYNISWHCRQCGSSTRGLQLSYNQGRILLHNRLHSHQPNERIAQKRGARNRWQALAQSLPLYVLHVFHWRLELLHLQHKSFRCDMPRSYVTCLLDMLWYDLCPALIEWGRRVIFDVRACPSALCMFLLEAWAAAPVTWRIRM